MAVAMTFTPHQRALLQLLPDGLAWNKAPDSVLAALCLGLSQSTARVDWTGQQLLDERFPDRSRLLLDDWERFLGLPECDMTGASLQERQSYAGNKYRMKPSVNREFYIELAAGFGFDIDIQTSPESQWISIINVKTITGYRHMNVLDNILTPLRIYDASALECILNRYKPAWQTFRYVYESSQSHDKR
ncbi:YmfQ family protein [Salmonella enterica subsp. enterica serovar Newport]|uniref:YmfQ family protein n=1 Tax=Salmonella enterica TaxID=28901 RepID=A0A760GSU4_SALER|nr:YmfQ family protein [Salmonella enterica]